MPQLSGTRGGNRAARCCLPRRHSTQALNRPFIHTPQASHTLHGTARDGMGKAAPPTMPALVPAQDVPAVSTQGWIPRGVRAGHSSSSLHAQEHDSPPPRSP